MLSSRLTLTFSRFWQAATLLTVGLAAAAPAHAQQQTFDLAWSGAALGNPATATGTITIDQSQFNNPGTNANLPSNSHNNFVTALNVTVAGSGAGDGIFSLKDFSFEVLDTHGATLDLKQSLIGQPTSGVGFGTTQDGTSGDFNLIDNNTASNTPTGKPYFQLVTNNGTGDVMNLTKFSPVLPIVPPPPLVITFDNLASQPSRGGGVSLKEANGGSSNIDGVTFSDNAFVAGDLNTFVFSKPHSGHFYFTPAGQPMTTLTTTRLLTGLWLGQDLLSDGLSSSSVTVSALHGTTVLASDSESLTSTTMFFMDTSNFSALSGITGYELIGGNTPTGANDFAADDFTFAGEAAAVPEASTTVSLGLLLALGMGAAVVAAKRKKASSTL